MISICIFGDSFTQLLATRMPFVVDWFLASANECLWERKESPYSYSIFVQCLPRGVFVIYPCDTSTSKSASWQRKRIHLIDFLSLGYPGIIGCHLGVTSEIRAFKKSLLNGLSSHNLILNPRIQICKWPFSCYSYNNSRTANLRPFSAPTEVKMSHG